jgi:hypothetical protein
VGALVFAYIFLLREFHHRPSRGKNSFTSGSDDVLHFLTFNPCDSRYSFR